MNKTLIIARHEFLKNLRRPAFLFAAFGTPLIIVFGLILSSMGGEQVGTFDEYGRVGYVDNSSNQVLQQDILPPEFDGVFVRYADEEAARTALDDGETTAYIVVPRAYMLTGTIDTYSFGGVPDIVSDGIESLMLANLVSGVDLPVPLERIQNPTADVMIQSLSGGREVQREALFFAVFLPIIFAFVLMMSSVTTSGFLMSGLIEERTNRIIEILVTTATPLQLLTGKIIGLGLLGLVQVIALIGAALIGLGIAQNLDLLAGVSIPLDMVVLALLYYLLSYFLLASILAGIGSVSGSEQESRQFSAVVTIPFMIPYFFFFAFLTDPNGPLPVGLSLFPLTSPLAMLMRVGITSVPFWQIAVSVGILTLTLLFTVWASAKVFRWGLLLYGKRLRIGEILRVILRREQPQMATSATGTTAQETSA
jgi:ABC-2 type transport system permease protein